MLALLKAIMFQFIACFLHFVVQSLKSYLCDYLHIIRNRPEKAVDAITEIAPDKTVIALPEIVQKKTIIANAEIHPKKTIVAKNPKLS